jgi:hypothetical protein
LQRVLTDFGADHAFAQAAQKLKEHYGIELSSSTIRAVTLRHANALYQQQSKAHPAEETSGVMAQVGQADGCMIPIMTPSDKSEDKRKEKTLSWKEARLVLVHEQNNVTPKFAALFKGSTDDVGKAMKRCADKAGFGSHTHFHGVGDGAPWIAKQVNDKFGLQGSYLIDFYHACEYLSDAASSCVDINLEGWIEQQKEHLKHNEYERVLINLQPFIEAETIENLQAPVRACYRYFSNRTDQLDYKNAIEKGLPIGSGEIESAHRYVIQARLKLSGAWWQASNVDPMLSLRVVRANDEWEDYWNHLKKA